MLLRALTVDEQVCVNKQHILLVARTAWNIFITNDQNFIQSAEIVRSFPVGKGEMAERSKAPA